MPLDVDEEHATYKPDQVSAYFEAAGRAAMVLTEFRAPYRGRSTRVNAWWGSFDLAVSLFSGQPADPPSRDFIMRNAMDAQEVAVGWWPGDPRHPAAAFYAYAHPAPPGYSGGKLTPRGRALGRRARRVHPELGRRPGQRRPARGGAGVRPVGVHALLRRCASGIRRWQPVRTASRRLCTSVLHRRTETAATASRSG